MAEIILNVRLSPLALELRRLRLKKNKRPEEVASDLKIEVNKLLYWEMDKALPTKKELKKLAEYYKIDLKSLKIKVL